MSTMTAEQLAEAYLAEKSIERTQRYLTGGRQFGDFDDDHLMELFVAMYRELILFDDDLHWNAIVDLQCEFDLRGLKTPLHRVAAEFALFKERLERLQRVGPCDPVAGLAIREELAELRERLALPKH